MTEGMLCKHAVVGISVISRGWLRVKMDGRIDGSI